MARVFVSCGTSLIVDFLGLWLFFILESIKKEKKNVKENNFLIFDHNMIFPQNFRESNITYMETLNKGYIH